jgi:hypothetical protein
METDRSALTPIFYAHSVSKYHFSTWVAINDKIYVTHKLHTCERIKTIEHKVNVDGRKFPGRDFKRILESPVGLSDP